MIGVLLVLDSLHFVFARLLAPYLPGVTSAMYVLAVATIEVSIFLAFRGDIKPRVFLQNSRFFLVVGFLVAASTGLNYIAVNYIDPGTASFLARSATIFALALSVIWLRERLSSVQVFGALLALIGVFIISFQTGDYLRLGSLMILASSFMYALHSAVVKRYFTTASGQLEWPSGKAWIIILIAGTVDVVISRVLYYLALRRLKMSLLTIILTLSPVLTVLWSVILFSERPSLQALIGGVTVLLGVIIVTYSMSRQR